MSTPVKVAVRTDAPVAAPALRAPRSVVRTAVTLLAFPVVMMVVWALIAAMLDSLVFPGPTQAVRGLAQDLSTPSFRDSVASTLRLLFVSWLLAAVAGSLTGFALGMSSFWSRVFQTPLFALYSVPKITLYPVFLLLLGIGDVSRVAFAFFHGFFPMALLVMGATATLDPRYVKLADALCMPWATRLRKILLPALLPPVVTALRISFGLTLLGLILGEMFSSDVGLGRELVKNVANVRVDRITGQVLLVAVIAIIPSLALRWLENKTTSRYGND